MFFDGDDLPIPDPALVWALDRERAELLGAVLDRIQASADHRARLAFAYRTGSPGFAMQRACGAWCQWVNALIKGTDAFEGALRLQPEPSRGQWVGPLWAEPEDLAPGWSEVEPLAEVPFHAPLFVMAFLLGRWDLCERIWTLGDPPPIEWISFLVLARPARTVSGALMWDTPPEWKTRLLQSLSPPRASALVRVLVARLQGDVDITPQLHDAQNNWLPDLVVLSDQPQIATLFGHVRPLWAIHAAADERRWSDLLSLLGRRPKADPQWPSLRHVVRRLFAAGEISLFCALAECNDWSVTDLGEGFLAWNQLTRHPTAQDWKWWRARLDAIGVSPLVRDFLWDQAQKDSGGPSVSHSASVNPLRA